jgi:hypothetical protein
MSVREPIAAAGPVPLTNRQAAGTLGAHRSARQVEGLDLDGRHLRETAPLRRAPVGVDAVDIGGDHQEVGTELARPRVRVLMS